MKLYLLPFDDQAVKFSFDKKELEEIIKNEPGLPYQGVLELEIDNDLAQKLNNPEPLEPPYVTEVPEFHYETAQGFLGDNDAKDKRLYVFFDIKQRCYWSPSGNNLTGFYECNPEKYLSKPLRVELDTQAYIKLMGYFLFMCENF